MRTLLLAAAACLAVLTGPAAAAEPETNFLGIPIAPQSGNASIHQWGGLDDKGAVNPDADEPSVHPKIAHPSANAEDSEDEDANDPGDPSPDDQEVLLI